MIHNAQYLPFDLAADAVDLDAAILRCPGVLDKTNVGAAPQFRVSSFDACPARRLSDELVWLRGRLGSTHKRSHMVCVMEVEIGLAHELTDSSQKHGYFTLYHQYQSIAKKGEEKRAILHGPRLPAQNL